MVHSVELLLDPDTEAAIRQIWKSLSAMGLRSPMPASRPHVTLVVADRIAAEVDSRLSSLCDRLPFPCTVGAPLVFGAGTFTLVRMVVPSTQLLAIHEEAHRICMPYATSAPALNSAPGNWSPHVTLARRVDPPQLPRALSNRKVLGELRGSVVGLRHWDGNQRLEHLIG